MHTTIQTGQYSVHSLLTSYFALDGGAMFGVVPKPLWERAYTLADERNRIPMVTRNLVLCGYDKVILIDTGNSPDTDTRHNEIYKVDTNTVNLVDSMAAIGLHPDDVTDVLLTHLHFDHTGGSVRLDGSDYVPSFKNATYYVQRSHYDWACNPVEKDRASFIPWQWEPLHYHGILELLDGPVEIYPKVFVDLVYGHTHAMQTVTLRDDDKTVFFPADLMPTAAHVAVPYVMGYDNQPLVTIAEKKVVIPQLTDENWLVFFEHDVRYVAATFSLSGKSPVLVEPVFRDQGFHF